MLQPTRRVQFAHFLLHKVRELRFRLSELLDVCQTSRRRFSVQDPTASSDCRLVNFHFSAFSSLIQTIKDILPVVAGHEVTWSDLAKVRHMQFMQAVRNAMTHDGNPVINLWSEGRYYVARDILRLGQDQKPIRIQAPAEDVETLVIRFTAELCVHLRDTVLLNLKNEALKGPLYGVEFFDSAVDHPAVPEFARRLYAEADRSAPEMNEDDPVAEILTELDVLIGVCHPKE